MDEITDLRQEEQEAQQQAEKQQIPDSEFMEKLEAHSAMKAAAMRGAGLGSMLSPGINRSPEAQIRQQAFSSAMQVHCHRTTDHEEILASARAFESYLKGESNV